MNPELRKTVDTINEQIVKILTQTADKSDPDGLAGKISELASLIPSSAQALAISEMIYNERIGELIASEQYAKMSATDKKMIFQGKAAKEIALMTYTERLNKGISHGIDSYRSVLSYVKTELEQLKNV